MEHNLKLSSKVAVSASALLVIAGCSSGENGAQPGTDGDLATLHVATIGLTSDGSLITGIEQGFFEEEGLEIETSIVSDPPAGLAAAQSGQVDIAYSPSIPYLNALSEQIPVQVIGAADGFPAESIDSEEEARAIDDTGLFAAADSGISGLEDLEGKTIAVPARDAQLEIVIAAELDSLGIDPEGAVDWVVLDFTSAVSALQSGSVDAAALVSPFTEEADAVGAEYVSSPSLEFFEAGAVGLWVAGDSVVDEKSEEIEAFQRAISAANAYASENQEEVIQAGLDYTESSLSVDEVPVPFWPEEVRLEDLQNPNEQMASLGFLPEEVSLDSAIYGD